MRSGQKRLTPRNKREFRLISEGVASVPAVYKFLSVEQKSKVIFVPRSLFFYPNTTDIILVFIL